MKSKKINIDRPKIEPNEINSFKNFNEVFNQIKVSKPLYQRKWFIATTTGTVIAIAIFSTIILNQTNSKDIKPNNQKSEAKFINPPIPKASIPYTIIKVNTNNDTLIQLKSGSSINIPAGSILSQSGKSVYGKIEIRIREFNDPATVFLSGIPMQYDSAGTHYTFETAGMIDIGAFKDNKQLIINPEKPIRLNVISKNDNSEFNTYLLDTNKKQWIYKGNPSISKSQNVKPVKPIIETNKQQSNTSVPLVAPILPQKANPIKWNIKIDVLQNEFPEFSSYKDVLFEVDKQLEKNDNVYSKTDWENVVLEKTETKGLYSLRFSKANNKVTYFVRPVYAGKAYTKAMLKYDSAFALYKIALKNRIENEAKQKADKLAKLEKEKQEYEIEREKAIEEYRKMALQEIRPDAVMRSFVIMNFGIWNCDRPFVYNSTNHNINAKYTINNIQNDKSVYLVDESLNAVVQMYSNQKLPINNKAKQILWAVTSDYKVAVFTSEQFNSIPKNATNYTFNLKELTAKIEKPEDFINLYNNGFR